MSRFYKIVSGRDGGTGSFLCPPKHGRHGYSLEEYAGPRGRRVIGVYAIDYVLSADADASAELRRTVQRIMSEPLPQPSEMWLAMVYGYYRHMWLPQDGSRNAVDLISQRDTEVSDLPPERHAAVAAIREYFPGHEPRTDLIENPGRGYGAWPCVKCGRRVQYEPRFDALAEFGTGPACTDGASHELAEGETL